MEHAEMDGTERDVWLRQFGFTHEVDKVEKSTGWSSNRVIESKQGTKMMKRGDVRSAAATKVARQPARREAKHDGLFLSQCQTCCYSKSHPRYPTDRLPSTTTTDGSICREAFLPMVKSPRRH